MACFSRESGSWGDSCVALLGAACLLVAILASAFTVAQWQRNRETYRWARCSAGHITNAEWVECPLDPSSHSNRSASNAGAADYSRTNTSFFPCVQVMVSYVDDQGTPRMGILHPVLLATADQGPNTHTAKCSVAPCVGSTAQNERVVRRFTESWRYKYDFSCYYNPDHFAEVLLARPRTSRALEVVVLLTVVICVVCILTTSVRCRCVYLNAREARSCLPSMSFFVTSSVRSLQALLWTIAYKLFDWKLQSSTSQTLSGHDTQGLVEQYREEREDGDPCLPPAAAVSNAGSAAILPRSPSVGYAQPRPSNAQSYTPLACPPSDIRL